MLLTTKQEQTCLTHKHSFLFYEKENVNAIPRQKILCERKAAMMLKNKGTTILWHSGKGQLYDTPKKDDSMIRSEKEKLLPTYHLSWATHFRLITLFNNSGNIGSTQSQCWSLKKRRIKQPQEYNANNKYKEKSTQFSHSPVFSIF